jgi:hypothetical protein
MNTFVEADSETVSVSFYFYFVGNDYKMTFAFD